MYGSTTHQHTLRLFDAVKGVALVTAVLMMTTLVMAPPAQAAPSAANTGVPAGTTLKKHYGDLVIKKAGTVIDAMDVHGYVIVKAPNVTIKRTLIRGNKATSAKDLLRVADSVATGFKVIDSTIRPDTPTVHHRIGIRLTVPGALAKRVNVSGSVDGIRIAANYVRVEASYVHDLRHYTNDPYHGGKRSHDDAVQVESGKGIRIVSNTLTGAYNAAVFVGQNRGAVSDLAMTSNLLDYGGCTVNIVKNSQPKMTGLKVDSNKYRRGSRVTNCPLIYEPSHSDLRPTGNVWADTGKPIPLPR